MEFKDWLKEERKKHNLSAKNLSERLGKSSSWISQIERGLIKEVSYDTAIKIVENLGANKEILSQFFLEHSTVTKAKDVTDELLSNINSLEQTGNFGDKSHEEAQVEERLRKQFERALDKHVDWMLTHELAGLLILLQKERHLMYELATIPSSVKKDRIAHVYDMIHKYIKFMKDEYNQTKE